MKKALQASLSLSINKAKDLQVFAKQIRQVFSMNKISS
jgi:hypothetical protein